MAIQFVGGNTGVFAGSTGTSTTVSLTALTGGIASAAAIGDTVIAVFSTGATASRALSITTGYTTISTQLYANGSTADTNLLVAYKVLTAADTTVTFGPTGNNADAGTAAVYVFRGVASSIFDVTTTTATGIGTGRPTPPPITPSVSGTVIVCVGAGAAGAGAVYTTATLSAFRSVTSSDTNDAMLGIGQFAWTSGTYTPAQFGGGTVGGGDSWAAMTIALREFRTPITTTILESDANLGSIMDATVQANPQTTTGNITRTAGCANAFIAPKTGQLGNFKASLYSGTGTVPTTQGAIELWQLASNSVTATPTTLLASMPINYVTLSTTATPGKNTLEFDLSAISGMAVTAGTGYAILIAGGTDWFLSTANYWIIVGGTRTTEPYQGWTKTSAGVWNIASSQLYGMELSYLNATLDSELAGLPYTVYDLESNATLGSTMNSTPLTVGSVSGVSLVSAAPKAGNSFIATQTGHLGNVKLGANSTFTSQPTTQGAIELWQLASNTIGSTPTTLLASLPISYQYTPSSGNGQASLEFDLSNVAGMTVTAGTGYALIIAAGSDWGVTTATWGFNYVTIPTSLYGGLRLVSGSWSTVANPFGFELDYTNATLDSQNFAAGQTITETVTATDSETVIASMGVAITETGTATETESATYTTASTITETGTATESESASFIFNTYDLESNATLGNTMNGTSIAGTTNSGGSVASGIKSGARFIAPVTGHLGNVKTNVASTGTGAAPTTQGTIELWQLASNSITATPSTLIASMSIPYSDVSKATARNNSLEFDLSNVSAMTVTAGVGYAIVFAGGSDWNVAGTKYWTMWATDPNPSTLYNGIVLNGGWIDQPTLLKAIELDYTNATLDSEIAGSGVATAITETGTATETETAIFAITSTITETGNATETESAVANFVSSITEAVTATSTQIFISAASGDVTETVTATDSETAIFTTNQTITEAATATDAETAIYTTNQTITETGTANATQSAVATFVTTITETGTATATQVGLYAPNATITETGTLTESQLATFFTPAFITESGTATDDSDGDIVVIMYTYETVNATDSQYNNIIANAWLTENTVSYNGGFTNTIGLTSSGATVQNLATNSASAGIRFIANQSAALGRVAIRVFRNDGTTPPTQPVIVTAWQLSNNTLTGLPSTNLGSVSLSILALDNFTGADTVVDFTALGINLVQGTGYAVTITAPSDISGSGYSIRLGIVSSSTARSAFNYFNGLYSAVLGTYPSSYNTSAIAPIIDVQPVQATAGYQVATAVYISSITETVTALDESTSIVAFNAYATETVTATDSEVAFFIVNADTVEYLDAQASAVWGETFTVNGNYCVVYLGYTNVWGIIDDSQTGTWQPVNDAQTSAWQPVNDSQTTSWTKVIT